jgi:hypothetical protein
MANGFEGVSKGRLVKMAEKGERAVARMSKYKEAAAEQMGVAVQTVEVGVASFGFGYARGRYAKDGEFELLGVPPDLLTGAALHVLAFMGTFDKYDRDAHNVADGALAAYLTTKGVEFGVEAKQKQTAVASGIDPELMSGRRMSDQEIAHHMANSAR